MPETLKLLQSAHVDSKPGLNDDPSLEFSLSEPLVVALE